jgi:hypothetical protein
VDGTEIFLPNLSEPFTLLDATPATVDNVAAAESGGCDRVIKSRRTAMMFRNLLPCSISSQVLLVALAIQGTLPDPRDPASFGGFAIFWSQLSDPDPFQIPNDSPDLVCGSVDRRVHSDPRTPGDGSSGFRLAPTGSRPGRLEAYHARFARRRAIPLIEDPLRSLCHLTC